MVLLPLPMAGPLPVCPWCLFTFLRDTRRHWIGAHSDGLILTRHLFNDHISQYSHILGCWELGLQRVDVGGPKSAYDTEDRGHLKQLGVEGQGL